MRSTGIADPGGGRSRFATTQWSLVLATGTRGSVDAEEALAHLCSLYGYPIFAFVRRQGYSSDEAQDLTQGFFARLVEKGDLGDADRRRGRFRSFLLTALSFTGSALTRFERTRSLRVFAIPVASLDRNTRGRLHHF